MRKALFVGILLFLVFLIARAPAAMLTLALDDTMPATLLDLSGTLWSGDADLLMSGMPIGRLSWSFRPAELLQGKLGYDLGLDGTELILTGQVATGPSSAEATTSGRIGAPFVNAWLAPYDIQLSGQFELNAVSVTLHDRQITAAAGDLTWDGGPLTYVLSGKAHNSALPPMRAQLGPGPTAVAYAAGESTPLLRAELQPNGFAKIGVTKYLTKILGNPWPGGDPDHAVVLEVEEQVF